jgi:hypothetical protein
VGRRDDEPLTWNVGAVDDGSRQGHVNYLVAFLNVASGKPVHTVQHSEHCQTTARLSSQELDLSYVATRIIEKLLSPQGHLAVPDIRATIIIMIRAIVWDFMKPT